MEENKLEQRIIAIIADKLGKKAEDILPTAQLVQDLGADSLDVVEMIMEFEDEFGISLPDEDVAKLTTVQSVIDYINTIKK